MRTRNAVVACLLFVTAGDSGAAATPAEHRWFRGVQVMPGGVVEDNRILYENGSVILIPAGMGGFDDCLSGYVCLFSDTSWNGILVQFASCCAWSNFADYGFNNVASSWRNRKTVDGQIAMGAGGNGTKLCLDNNSYASSMPGGWDNAASSIRVRDAGTYC